MLTGVDAHQPLSLASVQTFRAAPTVYRSALGRACGSLALSAGVPCRRPLAAAAVTVGQGLILSKLAQDEIEADANIFGFEFLLSDIKEIRPIVRVRFRPALR